MPCHVYVFSPKKVSQIVFIYFLLVILADSSFFNACAHMLFETLQRGKEYLKKKQTFNTPKVYFFVN